MKNKFRLLLFILIISTTASKTYPLLFFDMLDEAKSLKQKQFQLGHNFSLNFSIFNIYSYPSLYQSGKKEYLVEQYSSHGNGLLTLGHFGRFGIGKNMEFSYSIFAAPGIINYTYPFVNIGLGLKKEFKTKKISETESTSFSYKLSTALSFPYVLEFVVKNSFMVGINFERLSFNAIFGLNNYLNNDYFQTPHPDYYNLQLGLFCPSIELNLNINTLKGFCFSTGVYLGYNFKLININSSEPLALQHFMQTRIECAWSIRVDPEKLEKRINEARDQKRKRLKEKLEKIEKEKDEKIKEDLKKAVEKVNSEIKKEELILKEKELALEHELEIEKSKIDNGIGSLKFKQKSFKYAGIGVLVPGISVTTIGLSLLFSGIGIFSYNSNLLGPYGDDQAIMNNMSTGFFLEIAGGIITGIGVIMDIIAIPLFAKAWMLKKNIQYQENKSALIMPFCNLGSNIECGISIKI